jgi:DNA-binding HxlR family transcriptional regulator
MLFSPSQKQILTPDRMRRRQSKDGTEKIYRNCGETMDHQATTFVSENSPHIYPDQPPEVEALVRDIIGKIADKWTLLVLDLLEEKTTLRFGEISRGIPGVSQKMLTKTLRQMECDGLITRVVHPVIPPRVDYGLTEIGRSLTCAFCGVWMWAAEHHEKVKAARERFNQDVE